MTDYPSLWTLWKEAFLEHLHTPSVGEVLKQASLDQDLGQWTNELTTSVVKVCENLTWIASAKWNLSRRLPKPGKEYLNLDVTAFAPGDKPKWPMPLATFELENSLMDRYVSYALWKLLCVRSRLRVVFAYRTTWEKCRKLVATLSEEVIGSLSDTEQLALNGETVLAIGNRGEGETFPWGYFKFWMLNTNLGRFEKV